MTTSLVAVAGLFVAMLMIPDPGPVEPTPIEMGDSLEFAIAMDGMTTFTVAGLTRNAKGGYDRPEVPEDAQIRLFTKDGKEWQAFWLPADR